MSPTHYWLSCSSPTLPPNLPPSPPLPLLKKVNLLLWNPRDLSQGLSFQSFSSLGFSAFHCSLFPLGAGIAQSVVHWARCPAWCSIAGFTLLWASGRGDFFPLELTWVLTPNPKKTLLGESISWGLHCAHMHSITQTQKILTVMSLRGECWQ